MGPILFCAFINDIINCCCKSTSIHLYADDAQIYMSRPLGLIDDLFYQLNEDLEAICKWSKTNRLLINTAKTQVMCVHHSQTLVNIPRIMMNNAVITHVSSVKNLGFWLNSQLKCFSHVDSTVHKIYFVLRKLWFTASYLHSSLKLKLVKTLITPFLTYGANVLSIMILTII